GPTLLRHRVGRRGRQVRTRRAILTEQSSFASRPAPPVRRHRPSPVAAKGGPDPGSHRTARRTPRPRGTTGELLAMADISLDDFRAEVTAFFEANAAKKEEKTVEFVWGEGSDDVGLFEETDPE